MDRAREAGRPACPLLVVRPGRNAGCHLVLDIVLSPFRMIAPLAKFIEWASVQAVFRRMPHPEGRLQLDEAIQFLNGPDFMPVES